MTKLLSNGKPDIDLTIQKDTESDRQVLVDLKRHEKLGDQQKGDTKRGQHKKGTDLFYWKQHGKNRRTCA
jgi:hypothetical protein